MSTISGVGSTGSAWAAQASSRANAMREKMFAKVDGDGSGSVDQTELQSMLDHIGKASGTTPGDAAELLSQMDSDGSGGLSSEELDSGMKSLMPPPPSTMAFAQQRGGDDLFSKVDSDGSGGISEGELGQLLDRMAEDSGISAGSDVADKANAAVFKALDTDSDGSISASEFQAATAGSQGPQGAGGPPPGGMPPPPPPDAADAADASSSTATDPLDTNEDGVVSAQERAAGDLKELMKAMDGDGDGNVTGSEFGTFLSALQSSDTGASSSQGGDASSSNGNGGPERGRFQLQALRELVRNAYAAAQDEGSGSTLSVAA